VKALLLFLCLLVGSIDNIDTTKVRWGNASSFEISKGLPCPVVDSKKVYVVFPEYKTIVKENLKPGTARYSQLMTACTKKYRKALGKLASAENYVVIVEVGGVTEWATLDVTNDVIKYVK
tara:strand:+ start:364 stop:723 length:360 start_codon:yes stop_codon:yes gene_type:complete